VQTAELPRAVALCVFCFATLQLRPTPSEMLSRL
jgi:hypothetical protein